MQASSFKWRRGSSGPSAPPHLQHARLHPRARENSQPQQRQKPKVRRHPQISAPRRDRVPPVLQNGLDVAAIQSVWDPSQTRRRLRRSSSASAQRRHQRARDGAEEHKKKYTFRQRAHGARDRASPASISGGRRSRSDGKPASPFRHMPVDTAVHSNISL